MAKKTAPLLPSSAELLRQFGNRLRLARLRRQQTAKQVAERAGMAPMTLRSVERGGSGVTMGAYLAVMQVLGIDEDLDLLAKTDPMGRALQDARLPGSAKRVPGTIEPAKAPTVRARKPVVPSTAPNRSEKGAFASSEALANLIKPSTQPAKKKR